MRRPYVVTICSEKGGVGKTTVATNLAIYLKAIDEELPVTLFSFDNHFSVDRMFRIGRQAAEGDVLGLFGGKKAEELTETGEYGVQFIPSSARLSSLRGHFDSPELLADALAASALGGVVIIDTRPDLDIFTQNALYAADRVIVPVKDAPSLENCKNIFDFFDRQNLSRRPLRILPCLIDQRIRFEGPFRDPYQLLKAYAINRGYRCLEGFIAKSPKVESLNTNPEGKIYPVLTHGRNTEVHLQFTHLARQIHLDRDRTAERRLDCAAQQRTEQLERRSESFDQRRRRLATSCLICGKNLVEDGRIGPAGYYCETSDGRVAGFLEEDCFRSLVFRHVYGGQRELATTDPMSGLFRESAQRSFFALHRTPDTRNASRPQVSFYRLDEEGREMSRKSVDLREFASGFLVKERTDLFRLVTGTLRDEQDRPGEAFLLIRWVSSDFPEEILYDEHYSRFAAVTARVVDQLR